MDQLKALLQKRMEEHHLGSDALAATVCHNVNQLSDGSFTATRYKNGVLTLTVPSSSHAAELQARLPYWRGRVAERIAPNEIKRLYIRQAHSII